MDELLDRILGRINTDLFDCEMKEDNIVIKSKTSDKEYIIEFEEIPKLNLNMLMDILYKIDTLDYLNVEYIEANELVTTVRENDDFKFLKECSLILKLVDTEINCLEILEEIIKIVAANSGTYKDLELRIEPEEVSLSSSEWRV